MKPIYVPSSARPLQQHGTSLIEVLVALVVLSVGLLGLAGLQLNALKLNQTAMQRSEATLLAYSILDQMRADAAVAKAGGYDFSFGDPLPDALSTWGEAMESSLGAGASAEICRAINDDDPGCASPPSADGEVFRVSVLWNEGMITTAGGDNPLAGGEQTLTVVGRL